MEEFIEGRELYVGVLGNERLTRLPVWEMVFGSMPDSLAAIATRKVKWDKKYQGKYGITTRAAEDLPPAVVAQLDKLSRRIYRVLGLRASPAWISAPPPMAASYVLEANANPNLEAEEDFAESARAAGIAYDDLLARLHGPGDVVPGRVASVLRLKGPCMLPRLRPCIVMSAALALIATSLVGCATQLKKRRASCSSSVICFPAVTTTPRRSKKMRRRVVTCMAP